MRFPRFVTVRFFKPEIRCSPVPIDFLAKYKADLNIKNHEGTTPLHIASEQGNVDITFRLLNLGASAQEKNLKGETPIFEAVKSGNIDLVRLYYNNGASI